MKKLFNTLSICFVVAMFAVCGCLIGCSSKPEVVEEESPLVVEMVDIKEFFDHKKAFETNNSLGAIFEMTVPDTSGNDPNAVMSIACDMSSAIGDNLQMDETKMNYIFKEDVEDESTTTYVRDGFIYYTNEEGVKVKESLEDNNNSAPEGFQPDMLIIVVLWDVLGDVLYGGFEYTGVLAEKTTNTETGEVTYRFDAAFALLGAEMTFEARYNGNEFLGFSMLNADNGIGISATKLTKLDYPENLDEEYLVPASVEAAA
ncbi:MAG: hypothetical protein IJX00_00290 [Clostridia bacterium]|nr:hypothetical protein [Clostridia bacterium]